MSLLLKKEMCKDAGFKSWNLLINNDDSFEIKNENTLSSVDNEEQPLCDSKVKVLDQMFEKKNIVPWLKIQCQNTFQTKWNSLITRKME